MPIVRLCSAVHFTAEERQLYMECHTPAKQVFEQIRSWGGTAVSKRLLAINALLLPVRRICSGGALTEKELTVPDILKAPQNPAAQISQVDSSLKAPAGQECTICLDPLLERPVRTPCQHWFCRWVHHQGPVEVPPKSPLQELRAVIAIIREGLIRFAK